MTPGAPQPLLTEQEIRRRVGELARQISSDYADSADLFLVGVLRGAFIFLADLARQLTIPHRVDFIALASYDSGDEREQAVRLIMDLRSNIQGKDVLIVEDIVDTGHTLAYLNKSLAARHPASLRSCVLTCKPDRQQVPVQIDYLGFEIPDVWVVGYGLDFADEFRTLPYIGVYGPTTNETGSSPPEKGPPRE